MDVWEAANRDDLFSVTSLKHFPYIASSDFHKPKHLYSWKTLLKSDKNWPAIRKARRAGGARSAAGVRKQGGQDEQECDGSEDRFRHHLSFMRPARRTPARHPEQ